MDCVYCSIIVLKSYVWWVLRVWMVKEMKGCENVDFGVCRLKVFGVVIYKLLLRKN